MIIRIYFLRYDDKANALRLAPSPRKIPEGASAQEQASRAMQELLNGPDDEYREKGYTTEIARDTRLRGVEVIGGTAYVDLSGEVEGGGGSSSMLARLYQIVYTATEIPGIEDVRVLIDGKLREAMGGEGVLIDEPLRRPVAEPEF